MTDTCIPETVMRHLEGRLIERWRRAGGDRASASSRSEFLFDLLRSGEIEEHFQIDPADSWLIAAMEAGIPVYSPGLGGLDHRQHVLRRGDPRAACPTTRW